MVLTGYRRPAPTPRTYIEASESSSILLDADPNGDAGLRPGLDCIVVFDIDDKEALRRALGRKFDPGSDIHYHLDDSAPPSGEDIAPATIGLYDRLVAESDNSYEQEQLLHRLLEWNKQLSGVAEWYSGTGVLNMVDAATDPETIVGRLSECLLVASEKEERSAEDAVEAQVTT